MLLFYSIHHYGYLKSYLTPWEVFSLNSECDIVLFVNDSVETLAHDSSSCGGYYYDYLSAITSFPLEMCQIDKVNSHEQRSVECMGFDKAISNVTLKLKPWSWIAEQSPQRAKVG